MRRSWSRRRTPGTPGCWAEELRRTLFYASDPKPVLASTVAIIVVVTR